MKKVLWENDVQSIIIPPEEIEEKVCMLNEDYIIAEGLTSEDVDEKELTKNFLEWKEKKEKEEKEELDIDEYLIEEFLKSQGFDVDVRYCEDFEEYKDNVLWDKYNNEFGNISDFETVKTYEHLNSQTNWETIALDENWDTEIELEVDEDSKQSLDIWDGHNFQTGGFPNHEYFYKILEKDGEKVEDEFLLVCYDQYQGSLVAGIILDKEDLIEHIKELEDRDLEDYNL